MAFLFEPRVYSVAIPSLPALLVALRDEPGLVALDSALGSAPGSAAGMPARGSLVAMHPIRGLAGWSSFAELRSATQSIEQVAGDALPAFFGGGFLGAVAYEVGVFGEHLELPDPAWPTSKIVGGIYTDFLCIDHAAGEAWLVLGDRVGDGRPDLETRRALWMRALERPEPEGSAAVRSAGPLKSLVPAREHERRVECARRAIAAGEVYQLNLARRFTRAVDGHPVELYRNLRKLNAAPFMAYLQWSERASGERTEHALISASPELLLEYEAGRALTRPIKGTCARHADPVLDREARAELLASEKERAELAMIVDLERNDLGRVARPGGVSVGEFPRLQSFATVHHLVADVSAQVRDEVDAAGVLESLFPGGSISGAPKLRSMELIAELEEEGRGFFTGSLGFLDFKGRALFNILIRTIVWRERSGAPQQDPAKQDPAEQDPAEQDPAKQSASGLAPELDGHSIAHAGEVSFHVGGGITWNSKAAAEELETRLKGAALAAACCGAEEPLETLGVDIPLAARGTGEES